MLAKSRISKPGRDHVEDRQGARKRTEAVGVGACLHSPSSFSINYNLRRFNGLYDPSI
jgi:hypothetical protein